jgi:hypothetical protein
MNRLCIVPNSLAARIIEALDRSTSRAANVVHVLSVGPVDCGSVVHDALLDGPQFRLTIATELRQLWLIPMQEPVHLVILHHTLSESQLEDARWFVHEWWPQATIMVIRSDMGLLHVALHAENVARPEAPEALLGKIERLAGTLHE